MRTHIFLLGLVLISPFITQGQNAVALPNTVLLTNQGDFSAQMVEGIGRWLARETEGMAGQRSKYWNRDFSNRDAYERSVETNRLRLRKIIGAVDPRGRIRFEATMDPAAPALAQKPNAYSIIPVRWTVFEGVHGEGLLLRPSQEPQAHVILLPDADQTPESMLDLKAGPESSPALARRLVEAGCQVLVMTLVDRREKYSGNPRINRFTNQPHREWIYRQAYEMGRHIIGFEVQKILAALDYFQSVATDGRAPKKIGVVGYGEGGLLALYTAAIDPRIDAAWVSGYFDSRQNLWQEPIYRNVFGLLKEFGDAEIASLIAPRPLMVEHSQSPEIKGPPSPSSGRGGAAPGKISSPAFSSLKAEIDRANQLTKGLAGSPFVELGSGKEGAVVPFGSAESIQRFLKHLGVVPRSSLSTNEAPRVTDQQLEERQQRSVKELEALTQKIFHESERFRDNQIWRKLQNTNEFLSSAGTNRDFFWREVIGKIDAPKSPPNPHSRRIYEKEKWTGYEIVLDVFPDVFAWGYLLLPKDLKPGERRPVVVCQHGLEGVPADVVTEDSKLSAHGYYKAFAAKLAERGFIVYAPHNPYRGQDKFRVLQRKANPLGLSLFSFIIAQHEVATDWLASLPFVDPQRIAFYGLSYGGKTAMRVPAVLDRYCLSICSADFNEWIQKNVTTESPYSYMFTGEYEMPEFNLGHTFNYAEMASLIAPRPFMVERGHDDGVAPDSWVAYEYAKIRRMYVKLGIPERTEIEFFNGPHSINGQGTFRFLHRHLNWPEPR